MTEVKPVLLNESLEALDGSVVRVQQELGQSQQLRGPVPPVATVNYHGTSLRLRGKKVRESERKMSYMHEI